MTSPVPGAKKSEQEKQLEGYFFHSLPLILHSTTARLEKTRKVLVLLTVCLAGVALPVVLSSLRVDAGCGYMQASGDNTNMGVTDSVAKVLLKHYGS